MARHGRSALAAAVLAMLLATGCDDSEVEVSSSLLSADTVDGTAVAGKKRAVASAGPDDTSLLAGAKASDTAAYERSKGGKDELVQIGAWERSASLVRTGMDYLNGCLDAKKCHSEPVRFEAARLEELPEGTVAFSSVFTNEDDERISIKRSYTYVQPEPDFDGTLVMVSIERTGDTDPSDQGLQRLTEAQVTKTEDKLTKNDP